ncbi:unnamed protein product [Gulo gulo]|uniref:Uncharacterized protein n=1 Tax=Gulo gulo TaxID=48420 RepID=A0A9X9M7A2_GULGU|nr:unnamed protein product [Gulo gulo]
MPLASQFPGRFSLARAACPGPPRLPSAAPSALILSFPAPCLPQAGRKAHRQEGAGGVGPPTPACPAVPSQPSPAPGLSITEMSVI